jgi:hypothetical protein
MAPNTASHHGRRAKAGIGPLVGAAGKRWRAQPIANMATGRNRLVIHVYPATGTGDVGMGEICVRNIKVPRRVDGSIVGVVCINRDPVGPSNQITNRHRDAAWIRMSIAIIRRRHNHSISIDIKKGGIINTDRNTCGGGRGANRLQTVSHHQEQKAQAK